MIVILVSIFNFEEIKINVGEKIDYFLYNIKGIFVCFKLKLKIYLSIIK